MFFSPFDIVGIWLRGLIAVAIFCVAGWLIYEWQDSLPRHKFETVTTDGQVQVVEGPPLSFGERVLSWRPSIDWPTAALITSVLLLLVSFFGKWVASPRLFLKRGSDEPNFARTGEVNRVKRPDGTVLQVETYGPKDAVPIVLTHGWTNDSAVWYYVKKHLSNRFRLIVWDLPGHGLSDKAANNDYSVERFAHDLRAVLDLTGNKPAILIGHSLGGMTVQMYCKLYSKDLSERVFRIILLATTYTNPLKTTKWSSIKTALQKPLVEPLLYLTIGLWPLVWVLNLLSYLNGSAHRATARSSFNGTETRGQLDFSTLYTIKSHPAPMASGMLGMLAYDVSDTLKNINVPTLVIDCAKDEVILPEALNFIRHQIPIQSSASLIPARHMGNLEQNENFSQLIDIYCESSGLDQMNAKQILVSSNSFSIVAHETAN